MKEIIIISYKKEMMLVWIIMGAIAFFFLLLLTQEDDREDFAGSIPSIRGSLKGPAYIDMQACVNSGGMAGCPPDGVWQPFGLPFWLPFQNWLPYQKQQWYNYLAQNRIPWSATGASLARSGWGPFYGRCPNKPHSPPSKKKKGKDKKK